MTRNHERMLSGEPYNPSDRELVQARENARALCLELNDCSETERNRVTKILQKLFHSSGKGTWIRAPFFCDYGENISLGDKVYINFNCVILDVCKVVIGDYSLLGPGVHIYTASHPLSAELRRKSEFGKPVTIGADVWIGGGAIICPGVTIGARSVIGAGSVVTKNIPEDVLAAGNPCKVIRKIGAVKE